VSRLSRSARSASTEEFNETIITRLDKAALVPKRSAFAISRFQKLRGTDQKTQVRGAERKVEVS